MILWEKVRWIGHSRVQTQQQIKEKVQGVPKKSCQQNMYRWKGPNKSNDITISSQGIYREDDKGVSVDKTKDITLSLELKFK